MARTKASQNFPRDPVKALIAVWGAERVAEYLVQHHAEGVVEYLIRRKGAAWFVAQLTPRQRRELRERLGLAPEPRRRRAEPEVAAASAAVRPRPRARPLAPRIVRPTTRTGLARGRVRLR
jgi:hypothetical protein